MMDSSLARIFRWALFYFPQLMKNTLHQDTKILLLEGVSQNAVRALKDAGYKNIEYLKTALSAEDLAEKIKDVQLLGIRSRSQLTPEIFDAAENLLAVGCFCIGTNQVDLDYAQSRGIPVFNAPFANTRSVAELTIASIIHLMRGIPQKNLAAHQGRWLKSAANSYEVRGKKLGIVGHGNIGSQLSVLGSALGMHVYYYDIEKKLTHGNARCVGSLEELLSLADVISLHVPETPETKNMINRQTLQKMKPGSYLVNYARGTIVDIDALAESLESGHLLGAALDVFPEEPKSKEEEFISPLRGVENVLISPHVGGSTQEAQENIGEEVVEKLVTYLENGSTNSAVNFPEINLPTQRSVYRVVNIHENIPGTISQINQIYSAAGVNVLGQFLQTKESVGYVGTDLENVKDIKALHQAIAEVPGSLKTRIFHHA